MASESTVPEAQLATTFLWHHWPTIRGGCFWRLFLNDRELILADAVLDTGDKKHFGRRPVYTLQEDYNKNNRVGEGSNGRVQKKKGINQLPYPPAYARGFGFNDMSSWGVGKTPGQPWTFCTFTACCVFLVEFLLALLSTAIGTAGCGPGVFLGFVSMFKSTDGSKLYLGKLEIIVGCASGLLSTCALTGVFLPDLMQAILFGALFFVIWSCPLGLCSEWVAKLLAWASDCCTSLRLSLAECARVQQNVVARNKSPTDHWDDVSKCRRTVQTTFPRVDGFSYYDGPQFNVRSGWYFPACGRVALSVPRSRGERCDKQGQNNTDGEDDEHPCYGSFDRTRGEGILLGPSQEKRVAITPASEVILKNLYDVFLIHAGPQKRVEIDAMHKVLSESPGLSCFLDDRCLDHQSFSPTEAMRTALETCRHAVIVISKDFLKRVHPRNELTYAFVRREWIRKQYYAWESVWVVLYKISIDDYRKAMEAHPHLPDIGSEIKYFEFNKYKTWTALAEDIKDNILQQDGQEGHSKWDLFLQHRNDSSFPRTYEVYEKRKRAASVS